MAGKNVAEVAVAIGLDLSDFNKDMDKFKADFGDVGRKVGEAAGGIGLAMGGMGATIAAGLVDSVGKAADFEQSLSNIKSVMAPEDVQKFGGELKALALTMGADTKYSATEAANGIEELVKAGVSTEAIMSGGLKGALDLATAGGLELADAAEIASTALNAFKDDNLSVTQAANTLAGAANASATDVGELKFGLSSVAAVASSVGMSFNDTVTALAVFAQNGLKGSDAGTSLKTMLMNLQPQTKQQVALFDELGLATADGASKFFDAAGSLRPLNEIAELLQNSMGGLSQAQRLQAMETIFGSDAIRASNILFKEGSEGVLKMAESMGSITAADTAAIKMGNLNGAMEQLKGSVETAQISIGQAFVPVLTTLAGVIGGVVDWFNQLNPATQQMIAIGAAVAAGLLILTGVVGMLTAALGFMAAAEWAVILPIAGIIAAVVAVIAIIVALAVIIYQNWDSIVAYTNQAWTAVKNFMISLWDTLTAFLMDTWKQMHDNVTTVWDAIRTYFTVTIPTALRGAWDSISNTATTVWNAIAQFFKDWWFTILIGIITGGMAILIPLIIMNWDKIKQFTNETWTWIKETISKLFTDTVNWLKETFTNTVKWIGETWETLKTNTAKTWEDMKTGLAKIASNIVEGIKTAINRAPGAMAEVWENIKQAAATAWESVKTGVVNTINGMIEWINSMPSRMRSAGASLMQGLRDGISSIKIPIPDINFTTVSGPMGMKIPKIDLGVSWKSLKDFVPFLADGGITNGPTLAMIGEGREQEVVTPLSKLKSMIGAGGGGGGNTFYIYDARDPNAVAKSVQQILAREFRGRGVVT